MSADPFACAELGCASLEVDTLENCVKRGCPFSHQRAREEDAIEQARQDALEARRILTVEDGGPA